MDDLAELFKESSQGFDTLQALEAPHFLPVSSMIDTVIEQREHGHGYGGLIMPGFHASSLAHTSCVHSTYYQLQVNLGKLEGKKKKFPVEVLRKFDAGTDIHTRFQEYMSDFLYGTWECRKCHNLYNVHSYYVDYLKEIGDNENHKDYRIANNTLSRTMSHSLIPETRPLKCKCGCKSFLYAEWRVIDKKYNITSKMDGVFQNGKLEFIGWEIKSANSTDWYKIRKNPDCDIMKKYKKQFGLYLNCEGFKYGMFTIVNKDNQKSFEVPVYTKDLNIEDKLLLVTKATKLHTAQKKLPPIMLNSGCKDCDFYYDPCLPKFGSKKK